MSEKITAESLFEDYAHSLERLVDDDQLQTNTDSEPVYACYHDANLRWRCWKRTPEAESRSRTYATVNQHTAAILAAGHKIVERRGDYEFVTTHNMQHGMRRWFFIADGRGLPKGCPSCPRSDG